MTNTIKVGKFGREIEVQIMYARRCTRWDPYPQKQPRKLAAIVLGEVYERWPESGRWFRSRIAPVLCRPCPAKVLARVSPDALDQIETLIATR